MRLNSEGFRSFRPSEIQLSTDNFRPLALTREEDDIVEKEINFEVSASDAIRLKWAYYLSLLHLAQVKHTNHCALVIFDEPGQQEIETSSLHAFLAWSAESVSSTQQVIVATSEPMGSIRAALGTRPATVLQFDGFILQPISG